jgi:membrane protease YdiL (CAAX protease family)
MHDTASAATYETRNDWTPTAIWPIVVASIVFALMHWGQGLAPIPLFFLSCALGYLYRQTGSLVPSIIVHFVLNGFTMCVTLLQLL